MERDVLVQCVVERVGDCYDKHGLCCSEAIMVVMNRVFTGGLTDRTALQMGAGLCHGMGGAGCSCGALTGSVMMLSLFLGPHYEDGLSKKKFQRIVKKMHDEFQHRFGSSSCGVLLAKVKNRKDPSMNCLAFTKVAAEMVVTLLLELHRERGQSIDRSFLESRIHPLENYSASSSA